MRPSFIANSKNKDQDILNQSINFYYNRSRKCISYQLNSRYVHQNRKRDQIIEGI